MKQYLKLLMTREAREVLGRHWVHLWLLVLMLVATFASIAFSEGSMKYLKDKMEDPYTLWVNITKAASDKPLTNEDFMAFRNTLCLEENMKRFDYRDVLTSQYNYYTMEGDSGRSDYISARFFEKLQSPLIRKVLEPDNIVEGCKVDASLINDETMGYIITINTARKLGYDENRLPAYLCFYDHVPGGDSLGLRMRGSDNDFLPVALPVLAVVHRLPSNTQMLSGNFLYDQINNHNDLAPFDFISHRIDYFRNIAFYVADEAQSEFEKVLKESTPDTLRSSLRIFNADEDFNQMRSWKAGHIWQADMGDGSTPLTVYIALSNAVEEHFGDRSRVCRVYHLKTAPAVTPSCSFLSVEFNTLHHIGEFESFAKENKIQLEMEQVHSKQNFDAVTQMAGVLSAAMVIFSIVCIIMFMVNMLQGYFQKVKRNIGTFKAFGMNGMELIGMYVVLLALIVLAAVVMALFITWAIQGILPVMGIEKDGFNYLSLWNATTYFATAVIFVSTVATVVFVMTRLLSQTPGDLIYDRN